MSPIHQTLTDNEGNEYRVVSSNWLKGTVVIIIINFVALISVTALLLDNVHSVNTALNFNERISQRNKAMDEMLFNRAELQQWTYFNVCEYVAKPKQLPCLQNPQWWATPDKEKYSLIIDDPSGSGLFPKEKK